MGNYSMQQNNVFKTTISTKIKMKISQLPMNQNSYPGPAIISTSAPPFLPVDSHAIRDPIPGVYPHHYADTTTT